MPFLIYGILILVIGGLMMKSEDFILIYYAKKSYQIKVGLLFEVFSMFYEKKFSEMSYNQIKKLMKKHKLFDKVFLDNIVKINFPCS